MSKMPDEMIKEQYLNNYIPLFKKGANSGIETRVGNETFP
jgi:hypothetical protein